MIKIADCRLRIADFMLSAVKGFEILSKIRVPKSKIEKGRFNIIGKI